MDLTGKTFGKLTVIKRARRKKHLRWHCLCICGKKTTVRQGHLTDGGTKSCGCGRRLASGRAARNEILCNYKRNATRKGRSWEISEDLFDALTTADCHYCGQAATNKFTARYGHNGDFSYNGLDRKDSSKGYTPDNVVTCCKICQKCKSSMPYDLFIAFILRAGRFQWAKEHLLNNDLTILLGERMLLN
jgi:hypothetical protein